MGSGSYSVKDWKGFSASRKYDDPSTKTSDIYSKRMIDPALDPKGFLLRESVDGPDHPESTPIIIGLDVTGSMSPVLDVMARKGMKTVCEEIYKRLPVKDPHICSLGIGDVECDQYPFQATQFEADIRIFEQLEKLYLEGGGGGNNHESYILAWYFAKYRTTCDSFRKRGVKGFIFTIGDEEITPSIDSGAFARHLNEKDFRTVTAQEMFDLAFPEWNIFHVIVKQGQHASQYFDAVKGSWENIIGTQRTLPLDDHTKLGEVIVSTIEIAAGRKFSDVVGSWDGSTSVVVADALRSVTVGLGYQSKSLDQVL